jgi:hypothetical protein
VTGSAGLERRYRRLLAWYPRTFRREHEEELLGVLMAGAAEGRWRRGWAVSADVIKSAVRMRLRPGVPRSTPTVFAAVRLMYLGAAVELCTLITIVATLDSLRAAIRAHDPHFTAAQWQSELHGQILPLEIGALIAAVVWLWLAWANGRGRRWARAAFAGFFGITTLSLLNGVTHDAATYAPADLIAGVVLWLVALATVALIFNRRSGPHYTRP